MPADTVATLHSSVCFPVPEPLLAYASLGPAIETHRP